MSFGGKEHKVHSSDNVPISIDSIVANPKADCCKALKGKRTIFFIQTSHGAQEQELVNLLLEQ